MSTPGAKCIWITESQWVDIHHNPHRMFAVRPSRPKQDLIKVDKSFCLLNASEIMGNCQWHHPEFMMLEWPHAGCGYEKFMDMTEDLFVEILNYFRKEGLVR